MELFEIPDFTGYYADKLGNIYTTLKKVVETDMIYLKGLNQ